MTQEMNNEIIARVTEFFESPLYKDLAKQRNSEGSKVRIYKKRNKKGQLSAKSALSLLLDLKLVEKISFKETQKSV